MRIQYVEIPQSQPAVNVVQFPIVIVQCACGCGPINLNEHAYIYSRATGEYYADLVCLSFDVGEDINFLDPHERRQFIKRWEVEVHG